ncbi:uncharacterized protein LOC133737451 [Rosa rugosa]|uniref:uncharacterized protein LOC133737451 n=1 Tax=Rosa rugosa TaxID=74645 RepID=UPI002B4165D3|nr:uncharacterized protein LOC133737451 [Rosa rugosa]
MAGKIGGMKRWIDQYGLIDLGFHGSAFTWTNKRVKERLDTGFCNDLWKLAFPEAFIQHLPRMKSDHCPLFLQSNSSVITTGANRPFRFQVMWMGHISYNQFVHDQWKSYNGTLQDKVVQLACDLNKWNSTVFGNLFKKKRTLLARIAGI